MGESANITGPKQSPRSIIYSCYLGGHFPFNKSTPLAPDRPSMFQLCNLIFTPEAIRLNSKSTKHWSTWWIKSLRNVKLRKTERPSLNQFRTLRWRHNDHAGVSNHQPHGCLLNRLFRRKSKKTSKLRVTGLCAGNSPGTGEFPAPMASYAENVSIWWRHHVSHKRWRHDMEAFSSLLAVCEGNTSATSGCPSKRASNAVVLCCWSEENVEQAVEW